ncbi:hypothetical protein [Hymenobacter cheonanensis]|uniref:hypothetical protein n=1 Tax=Hymenobacter sp. CA2-7 TaxID=3063993 RepID=UPI0027122A73|nr:hypothetical protein [Hymenobacter sp. CA2-7]MDO7887376.1 hypothetical protein [Hymenobacter sp. CA2-7]
MKPLLLILAVALALSACKKDDPEASLPAATQEGANTGGYLLDGRAVGATGYPGHNGLLSSTQPTPPVAGGFVNDSMLYVGLFSMWGNQRYELTFFVRYHGIGTYQLGKTTSTYSGLAVKSLRNYAALYQDCVSPACPTQAHRTDSLRTGTLTLTYVNRPKGIIAGLFEFSAYDNSSKQIINVSRGRFDLRE